MKKFLITSAALITLSLGTAQAHTAWFEKVEGSDGTYQVFFGGHEGKLEDYPADKVKTVTAYDAAGNQLAVERSVAEGDVRVAIGGQPAMMTMHFDNGIHTTTAVGESVNVPMSDVPEALKAVNALKYHKTIVRWDDVVTKPVGQVFEVVPLAAEQPVAGQPMKFRVLIQGRPAADIGIGTGENSGDAKTDADGVVEFTPVPGFNKLWAGQRTQIAGNPDYTELSYEYLLTFEAP